MRRRFSLRRAKVHPNQHGLRSAVPASVASAAGIAVIVAAKLGPAGAFDTNKTKGLRVAMRHLADVGMGVPEETCRELVMQSHVFVAPQRRRHAVRCNVHHHVDIIRRRIVAAAPCPGHVASGHVPLISFDTQTEGTSSRHVE